MGLFLDSFWRAVAYCIHPRVIALSLLPLALMVALALGLGYLYWDVAVASVRAVLDASTVLAGLWTWLRGLGVGDVQAVVAPLLVVFAVVPLVVMVSLVVVAVAMTPSLVSLVAERRFAALERKKGGSLLLSVVWSFGSILMALVALVLSLPLWLVPPLILVLPPLIWGWLTYRVMAFDVLADHASADERRELMRRHRPWLLGMGVMTGYLGAAPSIVWASGVVFAAAFVVLVPLAVWIYTLVFAFSALWFAHYALAALQQLRAESALPVAPPFDGPAAGTLPDEPLALPDASEPTPRTLPPPG